MKKCFHVIWSSFGTYQLWDNRGHWPGMKEAYKQLELEAIAVKFHYELPDLFLQKEVPANQVKFQISHLDFLHTSIMQLRDAKSDRIAGDLDIKYINCQETYIELLVQENPSLLKKKISRIKSLMTSLLSLEYPADFKGRSTWGKGIWTSKISGDIEQTISILKEHNTHKIDADDQQL